MRLTFRIEYHTSWGESLHVLVDNGIEVELATSDGYLWQGHCEYRSGEEGQLVPYRYAVYYNGVCVRKELGGIPHIFQYGMAGGRGSMLEDSWRDLPAESYRYSSAFSGVCACDASCQPRQAFASCITLRALCPGLGTQHRKLALAGSGDALGNWGKEGKPLPMYEVQPNVWHLVLDASRLSGVMEYKFVAVDTQTGDVVAWECGDNRTFNLSHLEEIDNWFLPEAEVCFPDAVSCKIAGSAIPVFSLRSEGSFGVGDFGDLKTFMTWASETHQKAVQVLPINDTTMSGTWTDSYPYNSISIYALHPMYADLRQLPRLEDEETASRFEEERIRLNALPQVDYEGVNRAKRAYLKAVYLQEKDRTLAREDYCQFLEENKHWLQPYAAFCYLRDYWGTSDFNQWGTYRAYQEEAIADLCAPSGKAYTEIAFHYFVQYVLHVQLLDACTYGRSLGIIVKGDIPIGISRTSVEAWMEPYYFNMNGQAGAPPDAFSTRGQNWGMPTYNWKAMEKDGYQWWQKRFRKMADYFTAYRIDHILGFFRIWEIPIHSVHGLLGQFVPSLPMSVDEIEGFGLSFRKDFMTRPYIDDCMLEELFGEQSQDVRNTYVQPLCHGTYAMRPEFDTQRKVEACFAGRTDEASLQLKEGLYALISDVLFISDRDNPDMYHPRIAVQNDYIYRKLSGEEQDAFNRLYNHYYYQRHNDFWYREAMKKLPILTQSTSMLVCGEDLGMVPECVPWVMNQLQILSLEIQRMPKSPQDEFGHVLQYPFRSVCTIGTHDMSTFRGWWEEDRGIASRFFYHELKCEGDLPDHAPGWLCETVVRLHLHSPSMLCILTWQDWMGMDETLRNPDIESERINVPANPRHYWRWRMHLTLEELMQQTALNDKIRRLIDESGRYETVR